MRIALFATLLAFPASAWAACSSTSMLICVVTPPGTVSSYQLPCAKWLCANAFSASTSYVFEDGSFIRINLVEDDARSLTARLGFVIEKAAQSDYADLPVSVAYARSHSDTEHEDTTVSLGEAQLLTTRLCGAPCDGIDAEAFGN